MMRKISDAGHKIIEDLSTKHGFSLEAVTSMLEAMIAGQGQMAQFQHAEFAGPGQWMRGGMTMTSDMFNNALKSRIDGLCNDLSAALGNDLDSLTIELRPANSGSFQQQSQGGGFQHQSGGLSHGEGGPSLFVPSNVERSGWWGQDLGSPDSSGSQNDIRYALFAHKRRLAIEVGDRVTVYDTLDHQIGGFSQQQSHGASLTFTSQHGTVDVKSLPVIGGARTAGVTKVEVPPANSMEIAVSAPLQTVPAPARARPIEASQPAASSDIFEILEKLAALRDKGILSEEEFSAKKAELLSRL